MKRKTNLYQICTYSFFRVAKVNNNLTQSFNPIDKVFYPRSRYLCLCNVSLI